ncbi:MAG: hypothetical protein VX281_11860 [Pseudomonadota bacterium]|nr:hypothetical protein [Pseudomonadota bacterium]
MSQVKCPLTFTEAATMTRKKKTRSLSRIHQVKTGSIKKLKREAGTDRQSGKRTSKKNKSVFEKFLESNPEAKKQLKADQEAAARKKEATQRVDSQKDRENKREEETKERDPDLLSLLDNNKRDEDLY